MSRTTARTPGAKMDAWARRKAKVAEQEAAEARAHELAATEAAMAEKTDAEICAELDLPDPQDLRPGDDFTAFLKKEVPERLRRLALRKLWLSNPALANVDGLVDYGEDFTLKKGAGEVVTTAYRVGKGFAKNLAEEAGEIEASPEAVGQVEELPAEPAPEPAEELPQGGDEAPVEAFAEMELEPEPPMPVRRRMRFEFADQEMNTP